MDYDFHGWATKNDLRCSDGRTIRRDAFKECDGKTVPLVWQHRHDDPTNVLGHALLENRAEGVYVYGSLNNGEKALAAKEAIAHGDIDALSIYANNLQQRGKDVMHGVICEVSLVLKGANPGAFIQSPRIAHSDEFAEDEATIFSGELLHGEAGTFEPPASAPTDNTLQHEDDPAGAKKPEGGEKPNGDDKNPSNPVMDAIHSMNEDQKNAMAYMVGLTVETMNAVKGEEAKHSEIEEDTNMKRNAFDQETVQQGGVLSHADQMAILDAARDCGSFKKALKSYMDDNEALQHADGDTAAASGFAQPDNIGLLFPEYKDVRPGAPELITDDLGWVDAILRKVHKSPFSRIRTSQVDIRHLEDLRARGYVKGSKKGIVGNYEVARRETDPQTVFVKSALHRDDITDITDFDYVAYQYNIDQIQLREELATAMLLGDGRASDAEGKINPNHIRPIYGDDALFTIYKDIEIAKARAELQGSNTSANFGDSYIYAEAMIAALLDAKIDFRGTGTQDMFCTQQFFNKMMLAKDLNGRRIYANKQELATALGVNEIYPVSKMAGKTRTKAVDVNGSSVNHMMQVAAIVLNWADYSLGSTKGGQITHFTQFDIDFNQHKSLLETRVSGANTRVYSAIVLEEDLTA